MKKNATKVDLLSQWKNREKKKILLPMIPKAPDGAVIPLSNGQRRLWFLQDLNKENSFYNYGEAYSLKGDWSIAHLKQSIRLVYDANPILRSSCFSGNTSIELRVAEGIPLLIKEVDFSHLSDLDVWDAAKTEIKEDFTTPFDLEKAPLIRVSIVKIEANSYVLSITMHHIITDEWSMEIFMKQLSSYYVKPYNCQNSPIKIPSIQFSDFAYWDTTRTFAENELTYWKEKLSGEIPKIELQTDYSRPAVPSYKGAHKTIEFSEAVSQDLLKLAKDAQVTPFVLLLSVFYTLLHRYTGQTDILIGSPIANRNHKELEDLMGFFLDTLILRNSITSKTTFEELLASVQKNTLDAFSHKDVPFDVLVKEINPERSVAINPFFQVMFIYNAAAEAIDFGKDLSFEKNNLVDLETSKFDLTLFVSEKNGILSASFEYATDLFQETTIDRYLKHFELLAKGVVTNKKTAIGKLPMLTLEESQLFERAVNTAQLEAVSNEVSGIHQLIENIAVHNPTATAITFGEASMSYKQLNDRANIVAANLVRVTKGENQIVGLCISRSLEMIVGLLGILKSGSAYLPLDPEYPPQRTKYIIDDAKAQLVVTEKQFVKTFDELSIANLDVSDSELFELPENSNLPKVSSDDVAYVIYTSGSTGKPKGVPISHRNIIGSTQARFSFYDENPSAFLLLSSISFDSSKAGIFWTLCSGGNLVIGEKRMEQDMMLVSESIKKNNISHLLTLPTLYRLMLEHIDVAILRNSLTTVIVAGEACPNQLPELHFKTVPKTTLHNEYGPTEATVWCIAHSIEKDDSYKSIPIGKAIDGMKIHLLDADMNHVPFGVEGEIYITGIGLSKGYLDNEALTKSKFIENPFSEKDGQTHLYKSGDLGRYLSDGNIEFLGRADSQIKLRGFRIELDEIENTVLNHASVSEASVFVTSKNENTTTASGILIAYVVPKTDFDAVEVLAYLKKQLPKHMVPSRVIALKQFVRLPNGKVDKNHLQNVPLETSNETNDIVEATSETEIKLLKIWEEILGFNGLSVTDNFFEIGGDSIMTIQVIAKARKAGLVISPNQLFEYQTIAELASFVDKNKEKDEQWDYIVPLRKEGSKQPLFCVHAGGGHVFFYNKLTEHLDAETPIYALQPSGLYGNKTMHKSVKDMAEAYLKAIRKVQAHGPYHILVYCFSAAVGNEMAILLKEMGEEINLIIIDTMTAPAVLNTPRRLKIRTVSFLIRFLKTPYSSTKGMVIAKYSIWRTKWKSNFETDQESKELEKLRLNLMQLSQTYEWRAFSGNTSLILTKKDCPALNRETIRSWREISKNELNISHTEGSHRDLFDEPYVQHTAKAIEKSMSDQ